LIHSLFLLSVVGVRLGLRWAHGANPASLGTGGC
jgi:hypothetical protein